MLTVLEYAKENDRTVNDILTACRIMDMGYITDEKSLLNGDDIIDLDTYFAQESTEIEEEITELVEYRKKAKPKKTDAIDTQKLDTQKFVVFRENMTVKEFAENLEIPVNEVMQKLVSLGLMINVNQSIDAETAEMIAVDYNKELKNEKVLDITNFEEYEIRDDEKDLKPRPPVVTIMGHVDHGKTTLLDTIRKTNVVAQEVGGITQAISAYQATYKDQKITFIDTPGHAAFTEMRARGAKVTDIVIIIVAADDGIMPQTKEAIDHAKAADVPIMVAINKMDRPGANPEKVMTELSEYGLMPDTWGGDVLYTKVSALKGEGIDELLENILLIAEMNNFKANPDRLAGGTVIEASLDKNLGPLVTLLVETGTLKIGDPIVLGTCFGKIRTMKNDIGENIETALPSQPVVITGLNETPVAGDRFMAFAKEKDARKIWEERKLKCRDDICLPKTSVTLDEVFCKIKAGATEINVIIKADVQGSAEAVRTCLEEIKIDEIKIKVIRSSVGQVTESDIILAKTTGAIIIAFNINVSNAIKKYAKENSVDIRLHNIIYQVIEEMEAAMKGMLTPEYEEKQLGLVEVRQLFKFSKVGVIAGSYVTEGVVKNNAFCRVLRNGELIHEGQIKSIQREKDSVKEVKKGLECGITLEAFNDLKEGDILEVFEMVEIKRC